MYSDPVDIVIDGATIHLPRVGMGSGTATYQNPDGTYALTITQTATKADRRRHQLRLDVKKVVTDPLTSQQDYDSSRILVSIDRPSFGFSVGDVDALMTGIKTLLSTAFVTKLYGGES